MINELKQQLEFEKEQKRKVVTILDKRIKNLEKAINSIEAYNNNYDAVVKAINEVEIETIGEDE